MAKKEKLETPVKPKTPVKAPHGSPDAKTPKDSIVRRIKKVLKIKPKSKVPLGIGAH